MRQSSPRPPALTAQHQSAGVHGASFPSDCIARQVGPKRRRLGFAGAIGAEQAQLNGARLELGQGAHHARVGGSSGDFEKKSIVPRCSDKGTADQAHDIDRVAGERLERVEERARQVGDGEDQGCGIGARDGFRGVGGCLEQGEAGEVVGIVFDGGGKDLGAVLAGGEVAGNGGQSWVPDLHDLTDAAGSVLGHGLRDGGMGGEKILALGEGDGVRLDAAHAAKRRAGAADDAVTDAQDDFAGHGERTLVQQVIAAQHGTGESVLQGNEDEIGAALGDRVEQRFESGAGDGDNLVTKQLAGGELAKGSGLSLKGDAG